MKIVTQKDRQAVRRLNFCYICGTDFSDEDDCDADHVPPKAIFAQSDRNPLILRTHRVCNQAHSKTDERIGQLIALSHGKRVIRADAFRLQLTPLPRFNSAAIRNLDIDGAIWRWIKGFHASLYEEPLKQFSGSLVTPFPRADLVNGQYRLVPIREQHFVFVETIKKNRMLHNIDEIRANNGALTYECVWVRADGNGPWLCFFALKLYDWKLLGSDKYGPRRGCAGCYTTHSKEPPGSSSCDFISRLIPPNFDRLDPFVD